MNVDQLLGEMTVEEKEAEAHGASPVSVPGAGIEAR